jgi:hypothetical protein
VQWGGGGGAGQIILLGGTRAARLNGGVTPPPSSTPLIDSLSGYPQWLVMACLTVVAVVAIWLVAKLLKWSLYLLMVLVLIGGLAASVWLVFN